MDAYATIQELYRIAALPVIDDAQLDLLVSGLSSYDSYSYQEDGGYGSTYAVNEYGSVSTSAETALTMAIDKVLPRLVQRVPSLEAVLRHTPLRIVTTTWARTWVGLTSSERTEALATLDQLAGGPSTRFATLSLDDKQAERLDARARDVVALRVLAIDAVADAEDVAAILVRALLTGSSQVRQVANDSSRYLRGSRTLGTLVVDALLSPGRTLPPGEFAPMLRMMQAGLDAGSRARLLAVVEDPVLGWAARRGLSRYFGDATAEAELPLSARLLSAVAQECSTSAEETDWLTWLAVCGPERLAAALLPTLRARLAAGAVGKELKHLALLGKTLAPIAPDLLRYLDPKPLASPGITDLVVNLAGAIGSPLTVPALVRLLDTTSQEEALLALAAIGPGPNDEVAAVAVPVIEKLRCLDNKSWRSFQAAQQAALKKLRKGAASAPP